MIFLGTTWVWMREMGRIGEWNKERERSGNREREMREMDRERSILLESLIELRESE